MKHSKAGFVVSLIGGLVITAIFLLGVISP
jgi:hypothetical protein